MPAAARDTAARRDTSAGWAYADQHQGRPRPSLTSLGSLMPDSANNNTFDMASAKKFYLHVQRLGLRLTILTRFAAYAAPVARSVYDSMAETGSPVATRLKRVQRSSIEDLWKRSCGTGTEQRRGLPDRCDRTWFCNTFCNGEGTARTRDDSIWDLVSRFNVYDPLTLLAAVPHLAWVFFAPEAPLPPVVGGCDPVRVIGLSESESGLKFPPERLMRFLTEALYGGIKLSNTRWEPRARVKHLSALSSTSAAQHLDPMGV